MGLRDCRPSARVDAARRTNCGRYCLTLAMAFSWCCKQLLREFSLDTRTSGLCFVSEIVKPFVTPHSPSPRGGGGEKVTSARWPSWLVPYVTNVLATLVDR